jgi:minor extracellular serine protease Vpr
LEAVMTGVLAKRSLIVATIAACSIAVTQPLGSAQEPSSASDVSQLEIPPGAAIGAARPAGEVDVWITLTDAPLGEALGRNAKRGGGLLTRAQQVDYARQLSAKQDALVEQLRGLGARELARVSKAHNAIAVRIDAAQLDWVAALDGVRSVRVVKDYQIDLSETVPYIGASAVQAAGVDGSGTTVAILDSGIDYTHRNLGGRGVVADYVAAYGTGTSDPRNKSRDGLFPTAKVVAGIDFVGEAWPNAALSPDDDPIDFDGHGTHVADIVAGHSLDNTHKGVAPGASLVAVKVCSSVSTACSGIALLQAMDFALDPNGDGDISDGVDVINMSLGADYGQQEDDLTEASAIAVRYGVVVVAAAGNAGNRPYIVNSPSIGEGVISVAQTNVPSALTVPLIINSPASIAGAYPNTATLDFAPVGNGVTGNVAYVGRGCPAAGPTPADPYLANPAGKIALIDRGVCAISLKIDRAAAAGATGVLIGLVAPGDAISFSYGGGTRFVPSLVITQAVANLIKANIAAPVNATISNSNAIPLVSSIVGSSARGPSYSTNGIKPDIGAPGASVSAVVGTGTGQQAFGGTSGATPMITGSAALVLQAHPTFDPTEVKAVLMNSAHPTVYANPALLPGVLAPITRIGAGEVRVDKAVATTTAAWDDETGSASLSFGYEAAWHIVELHRRVSIRNYDSKARRYSIASAFRYVSDESSGAVKVSLPESVQVPAGKTKTFNMGIKIDPTRLPTWNLNGGSQGGNGALLDGLEFDGYVSIADESDTIHLPWHVLPHKAAAVSPATTDVTLTDGSATVDLTNDGAVAGRVEIFSLTGTSDTIVKKDLPQPGDNFAVVDLHAVGVRLVSAGSGPALQFGISTNGTRSHPNYPAEFDIYIDSNRDGRFDYALFNVENGGFGVTGQNVVAVANLATNTAIVRFFADADLDSGNMIETALLSDLGLTASTKFDFAVRAYDNYFTGHLTDSIEGMTYTPALPRFTGSGVPAGGVPTGGSSALIIQDVPGGDAASPSQTGLLLLYRDAPPTRESSAIVVN